MSGDFYVYLHKKKTTNEVFYVGKGTGGRATSRKDRSEFWKRIVKKYGYVVEIVENNLQEWYSFELEKELITYYGRRDLGAGTLVNLTDGGEGSSGVIQTIERRLKTSKRMAGAKHPNASKTVYELINIKTKEVVKGTILEFRNKFNLEIFPLFSGQLNSLNNWTLKSTYDAIEVDILFNPRSGPRNGMFDPAIYSFTNLLTNDVVEMTRLDFSNKYKLNVRSLFSSRIGNIVDHWCLTKNKEKAIIKSRYDYTIYTFKNNEEIFRGNQSQFRQKYGIDPANLLRTNASKSVHGWSLVNDLT